MRKQVRETNVPVQPGRPTTEASEGAGSTEESQDRRSEATAVSLTAEGTWVRNVRVVICVDGPNERAVYGTRSVGMPRSCNCYSRPLGGVIVR